MMMEQVRIANLVHFNVELQVVIQMELVFLIVPLLQQETLLKIVQETVVAKMLSFKKAPKLLVHLVILFVAHVLQVLQIVLFVQTSLQGMLLLLVIVLLDIHKIVIQILFVMLVIINVLLVTKQIKLFV